MEIKHPSFYLEPDWVKIIRDRASEAESMAMLHPDQLAIIYDQAWFKILVPAVYSGRELSIPELVRLEESISWADGSVGWVVTLCCGAGWFGGFLHPDKAKAIFNNPLVCLAGSGAATGTATIADNGYVINGTWKYASGAHHATHFTANCIIKKGNETVLDKGGNPLILPFIFDCKDVEVFPAWKYVGMMGTGSDAFRITNLAVRADCCFKIDPEAAVGQGPLYQYPFLQLAEATLAANISGIAIHFMDLCADVFNKKQGEDRYSEAQKALLSQMLKQLTNDLESIRRVFYAAVDRSWAILQNGDSDNQAWQDVSSTSRKLAKTARECVDQLYPYCGLQAANPESEINKTWRDIHTASQHSLLTFSVS
ncbi:acyl-CoA dehydrogenase [Mucilaginibacter sp. BT774]|uniref:acyl-CoA dehydrogenase n=1 Tax=Mucilaginibacter sp. BT774 TaxID=3062276 RepID=UPI002674C9BC|nr:acyl-CoA dehydrogenase [Mucilaginibacter sp. BT774]MDO3626581.1 acyl-CoA dehydrogenase [Mucilaginibacter sp. BT774]